MMTQQQGISPVELESFERKLREVTEMAKNFAPALDNVSKEASALSQAVQDQLMSFALSVTTSKLAPEHVESFLKHPYVLTKARGDSWYIYIPRFVDMQVGYLEQQTESHNKFVVNRYADWLGGIPEALKKELGLKTPLELQLEGDILFGTIEAQEEIWQKLKGQDYFISKGKDGIKINPKRSFELIAALVKEGILPFKRQAIDKSLFIESPTDFTLRDYQIEGWEALKRYSAVGIFWPPGTGKTWITMYALSHIKGPHLIVVPNIILREQWEERIRVHCPNLKIGEDFVVATYQTAINKLMNRQWTGLFIDEAQHLPANTFVNLSRIKRVITVGLTATPQREDGREEYIFALTGFPVGLSWEHLKKLGVIKSPTCHVWVVKDDNTRNVKLGELLAVDVKTIVYSDSLDRGRAIAKRFGIPFVSGETKKDRLKTVQEAETVVLSRVGDQGISIPDIERVIEVDWLGGSRRQELQRFGRLLHRREEGEPEHHIIMTANEYNSDRKRLFSIVDKGFKMVLHRDDVPEAKIINNRQVSESRPRDNVVPRRRVIPRRSLEPSETPDAEETKVLEMYRSIGLTNPPRFRDAMNKGQKRTYDFLVMNDGKYYPAKSLATLLGYMHPKSYNTSVNLGLMVEKHWIESKRGTDGAMTYGTNLKASLTA